MQTRNLWLAFLFVCIALMLSVQSALAHESIKVGDYTLEVGWLSEPPVVGQHNAITVHVTANEQPVEDISALTITISYGGQEKTLTPEPIGEHSPGEFMAPILPTVPGEYSIIFGGTLGDTAVEAEAHVEEVQSSDTLAFPVIDPSPSETNNFGIFEWLAMTGFVSGLAALIISLFNMRNRR